MKISREVSNLVKNEIDKKKIKPSTGDNSILEIIIPRKLDPK